VRYRLFSESRANGVIADAVRVKIPRDNIKVTNEGSLNYDF